MDAAEVRDMPEEVELVCDNRQTSHLKQAQVSRFQFLDQLKVQF